MTTGTPPPYSELVTKIGSRGSHMDHADLAALVGGIVSAVLLVLLCIIAVLMWCMTRQKGTYVTNEMDDDDNDVDNHDDESVGSNAALQIKEPLKSKDEE